MLKVQGCWQNIHSRLKDKRELACWKARHKSTPDFFSSITSEFTLNIKRLQFIIHFLYLRFFEQILGNILKFSSHGDGSNRFLALAACNRGLALHGMDCVFCWNSREFRIHKAYVIKGTLDNAIWQMRASFALSFRYERKGRLRMSHPAMVALCFSFSSTSSLNIIEQLWNVGPPMPVASSFEASSRSSFWPQAAHKAC